MTARRGYPAVDRFRVAAALLVVCIHTAPLASFSAAADFAPACGPGRFRPACAAF